MCANVACEQGGPCTSLLGRGTSVALLRGKFAVQCNLRQAVVFHSDNVPHPVQSCLKEHGLNTRSLPAGGPRRWLCRHSGGCYGWSRERAADGNLQKLEVSCNMKMCSPKYDP